MRSGQHLILLTGLTVQVVGAAFAPKRLRGLLTGLAIGLDLGWCIWFAMDDRSLAVSGFWSLSPIATWIAIHCLLGPVVGVECLSKFLPQRRWTIRVVGIALIVLGYGWGLGETYGPPAITRETLVFPDLPPAFEGYRIALIGDIHAGPYAGTRTLRRWAPAVADQHCDLLIGAGDFIAFRGEEAERTGVAFAQVNPPDGRIGILGNHDLHSRRDEVAERLRRHGWVMLENEAMAIERADQRLLLFGANYLDPHYPDSPSPAWKGKPWPEGFRIGIGHSPVMWPEFIRERARLTLAAHTHGGQVDLRPFFNAAEEFTPYVSGLFRDGAAQLFVTRGLGVTSIPIRIRCRPEIAVLTLRRGP